ncbi:hypothetical protein QR685DRAFT_571989 [Neurospora intermedia]|uniref:Uncharacterized protein n=1 Tax=Neurospora intermedia TaxID=5142 RepID=A0ABR3DE61_NEUIN
MYGQHGREDPRNNRNVANNTIKTVWFQQGFPDLFPSNETRRWIHPCETDSLVLAQCQGNANAPCPQKGKSWKPRGSKEEARRRQCPEGTMNRRVLTSPHTSNIHQHFPKD